MPMMGMPMGLGMPMAHMGMPMAMPMMGMMGMSQLSAMAHMMPMGMTPMVLSAPAPIVREKTEAEGRKEQLLRDLEEAGAELEARTPECATTWDKRKRKWVLSEVEPRRSELDAGGREADQEDGTRSSAPSSGGRASAASAEEAMTRCHLHPPKKPSMKCKFCQRAVGAAAQRAESAAATSPRESQATAEARSAAASSSGRPEPSSEDYSRRTFNCSPMLKDQIFGSTYFKSLLSITALEDLVDEIGRYADTIDVYNGGSTVSPSCFICQVYRLFTLPQAEDMEEIQALIDNNKAPVVRCAGFLYMRFVVAPAHLWEKMEEYLFDDTALRIEAGGKPVAHNTIGEYVEALLGMDRYFSTPLPRIPVKVRQALERELAPLQQYRKRMQANQRTFRSKRIAELPVEVCIDGNWIPGLAKDYVGRARRKILVHLDDGTNVTVHLGKVVLREANHGSASDAESEDGRRRIPRRSRSRRRAVERDWSRWKGKDEIEMIEELRERHREEAVCGHGKAYARRPLTVEEELWRREPETRVSMLGDESHNSYRRAVPEAPAAEASEASNRRTREEDEARQRRLRDIYEKYGSASKVTATKASKMSDIDGPDVLRLG